MNVDTYLQVGAKALPRVGEIARSAEALGFDGIWTNETKHDAFLPLALAAEHTTRIELGTSIAVAFSRSPMVVAQIAWDLQDFSGGRLILGLGTQVRGHIQRRFSMPWSAAAPRMREYVLALRAIWRSFQTGERLDFRGEQYQHTLLIPFFNPGPIEWPGIPVHIAGVNTALARVAGEVCDGFHVHPFHTPQYVREVIRPAIATGAARANRSLDDLDLVTSVFVVTGRTPEAMEDQRQAVRQQIAFYASTPTYRPVLAIHGWQEAGEALSRMAADGRWAEMPSVITNEMLDAFAVEAAPDEVGGTILERYRGIVDRVSCYLPYEPGVDERFWRTLIESIHAE